MLDKYAVGAFRHHAELNLNDFSDAGTLRLARFAHDMASWHYKLKEVVVAALDMATKRRAACQQKRAIFAHRLAQSLE